MKRFALQYRTDAGWETYGEFWTYAAADGERPRCIELMGVSKTRVVPFTICPRCLLENCICGRRAS